MTPHVANLLDQSPYGFICRPYRPLVVSVRLCTHKLASKVASGCPSSVSHMQSRQISGESAAMCGLLLCGVRGGRSMAIT
jgi:hypothetical protein